MWQLTVRFRLYRCWWFSCQSGDLDKFTSRALHVDARWCRRFAVWIADFLEEGRCDPASWFQTCSLLRLFFPPSHSNMRSENKMAIQSDYQAGPLLKDYSFMLFSLMADVILQTDKEYTWVCRYSLIMINTSDDYLQSESSHHWMQLLLDVG